MNKKYDVVIIGGGSVGVPTALSTAKRGLKVAVIESNTATGQGQNKRAIGGVRATHSSFAKIKICLDSIRIFSTWKDKYGHDIEWEQGGYVFVAYTEKDEKMLKETINIQQKAGLNINWVTKEKIKELVPGIVDEELRGGTYSPEDGTASPILCSYAFYDAAKKEGADFFFEETVTDIKTENGQVKQVKTDKNVYETDFVINAAGSEASKIGKMVGIDLPIFPDSHESGITEPVKKFVKPLVVDIRSRPGTKNFYFYQNKHGQFILCLTPDPLIPGTDCRETSVFLPQVAQRITELLPRTKHLKIRRTWRGIYPMTPDGSPIVGPVNEIKGYINAVGMCGQGFMLGPGLGELLFRLVANELTSDDKRILEELSLYRDFKSTEKLK
ncbi:MAG: FAD-binding oxidoreductase [Candidatus Heimdallarchaeum endolithica]|uniref:FAD-binding oxidoreductase n=1 Tax=Candidatus Heimdallarchaeum endolithica TaxID=2876572 RepID=A0A9Y1BNG1_9ARCH|nr:MAG: FAD-binding oxidoreductase [Candidatus Heimdallarchaeum endolithica]